MTTTTFIARLGFCMWACALVLLLASSLILPSRLAAHQEEHGSYYSVNSFHRKLDGEAASFVQQSKIALKDKDKRIKELEALLKQEQELNNIIKEKEAAIQRKDQRIANLQQEKQVCLKETLAKKERTIQTKDVKIKELEETLHKGHLVKDMEVDGFRPLRVVVTTYPRMDMLGAYTLPLVFLLSITYHWGWEMEVLPYKGSIGERKNRKLSAMGHDIIKKYPDGGWGTGFQDANFRPGYDPSEVNARAFETLGFFPYQPFPVDEGNWTKVDQLPAPGEPELYHACSKNPIEANGHVLCRLILPFNFDTNALQTHITRNGKGKLDMFLNPTFRKLMRTKYMEKNGHRVKHYRKEDYNVAIHVRRGDVSANGLPARWTDQSAFAVLARHLCRNHTSSSTIVAIHVFSSGKNEGNWTTLEQVKDTCRGGVQFHLDEDEFDTWAHFVAADALVMSKSDFSYVPAFLSDGDIYCPHSFGHPRLAHWYKFGNENGTIMT